MRLSAVWSAGFLALAQVPGAVKADESEAIVAKPRRVAVLPQSHGAMVAHPGRPQEGIVIVKAIGSLDFNAVDLSSFGDESAAH